MIKILVGASLALALLFARAQAPGAVTPTAVPPVEVSSLAIEQPRLLVYSSPLEAVNEAIAYWNGFADQPVMGYAGMTPDVVTVNTVIIDIGDLDGYAGVARGSVGVTETRITIDSDFVKWQVVAHELGHALGLEDYNTDSDIGIADTSYSGIMSYADVDRPSFSDDRELLNSVHH